MMIDKNNKPSAISGFFINWPVFSARVEDFICIVTAFALGITFCAFMIALFLGGIHSVAQWLLSGCVQ